MIAVPLVLVIVASTLVAISPWVAVIAASALVIGAQAAVAKRWTSARPTTVSARDAPAIHAVVERLCAIGMLDKPKIVLHDARYANSWVTGLTKRRTTLHLTTRLVELLDDAQLQAVIAHELAHIGQKDSALMSAVGAPLAAMLDGADLYLRTPAMLARGLRAARAFPPEQRGSMTLIYGEGLSIAAFFWLCLLPAGVFFAAVGMICRAMTATFSRARELEADAGAARLTGNPAALASALMILTNTPTDTVPTVDLRRAASLDVFHIVAVGHEYPLVHTHPTLKRRLKQLSGMEARQQRPR